MARKKKNGNKDNALQAIVLIQCLMIQTTTTSQKTSSATFHKISIIDNGPEKGYPVFREGPKPPSLLGQPDDQLDQGFDQVQDRLE